LAAFLAAGFVLPSAASAVPLPPTSGFSDSNVLTTDAFASVSQAPGAGQSQQTATDAINADRAQQRKDFDDQLAAADQDISFDSRSIEIEPVPCNRIDELLDPAGCTEGGSEILAVELA
jgi:hypothetical protein